MWCGVCVAFGRLRWWSGERHLGEVLDLTATRGALVKYRRFSAVFVGQDDDDDDDDSIIIPNWPYSVMKREQKKPKKNGQRLGGPRTVFSGGKTPSTDFPLIPVILLRIDSFLIPSTLDKQTTTTTTLHLPLPPSLPLSLSLFSPPPSLSLSLFLCITSLFYVGLFFAGVIVLLSEPLSTSVRRSVGIGCSSQRSA